MLPLIALIAATQSFACTPPPPQAPIKGTIGAEFAQQNPDYFAFVGKVVGYTSTSEGHPALSIRVLDAWTTRQTVGEVIAIGVAQWQGCGLAKPMGDRFQPGKFPIGSTLRIVSKQQTMYTWDVDDGIRVLESGS